MSDNLYENLHFGTKRKILQKSLSKMFHRKTPLLRSRSLKKPLKYRNSPSGPRSTAIRAFCRDRKLSLMPIRL